METNLYQKKIISHYEAFWNNKSEMLKLEKIPAGRDIPNFNVLEFKPARNRNMWTYATCGLSVSNESDPLELHLFSSCQDRSFVELLTVIAFYHRTDARLGLHHTVNFGRPWQNGSSLDHGFISLPYLDGPRLENFDVDKKTVKFLWLIPISKTEVEYKKKYGVEALELKFDRPDFNYLDANRKSVV
jgi:hypothetical protein